ncbi:MAG TPA: TetR/AcrR family transcriptional regulator [Candidatus Dormibacteraeota bacterium]|nr:TetR/AcrR family transcriptional regulator [Candidatus Dormibacteraeota bacterium]
MPRAALTKVREAPASTKARILAAAEAVFSARGFDGASTREIAAAAGVNISSLHYHWESKETLYFAVFEHVYDRILELVRSSIPDASIERPASREVVDEVMGRLYDFFADNPTIPRLMVRRLLETTTGTSDIEREILLPAWRRFATWTYDLSKIVSAEDAPILMLTVHSVLLLFMLDSQQFSGLLGGSVRSPEMRARLRPHIIELVHVLIRAGKRKRS